MPDSRKKVIIAGASGLVGRRLITMLDPHRFEVFVLGRRLFDGVPTDHFIKWRPSDLVIEGDMPDPDIVINLAGEGIADGRWSAKRKQSIISSRVDSARTIKAWLDSRGCCPELYIAASAVGYYGDRGGEVLTESSAAGVGFLSESCQQWEEASANTGVSFKRLCMLRIGIVLSLGGGALPKLLMTGMLRVFAYFGHGRQYYPWVHIDDLCRAVLWCIDNDRASGVYNVVAPEKKTCRDVVAAIKRTKGSFGLLVQVPAVVLRLALGEMADVLLNSNRVVPERLTAGGFVFRFASIKEALSDIVNNKK